jgi:hypothetical protein
MSEATVEAAVLGGTTEKDIHVSRKTTPVGRSVPEI